MSENIKKDFPLSEKQQEVVDTILSGKSCSVLGEAGTGKTVILKKVISQISKNKSVAVCAPTAAAAINVGFNAMTCHRLFGLAARMYSPKECLNVIPEKLINVLGVIDVLIIEEIGMVRRDILEMMDFRMRTAKVEYFKFRFNNDGRVPFTYKGKEYASLLDCESLFDVPFGGSQVVMVGDGLQLPPVVNYKEKDIFYENYDSAWFFTSDSFLWLDDLFYLTEVFRQSIRRQRNILKSIRNKDERYNKAVKLVNEESTPYDKNEDVVSLCAYKADAKSVNDEWYNRNPNEEVIFYSLDSGDSSESRNAPIESMIKLKLNSRVKICANNVEGGYFNGMTGVVVGFSNSNNRKVVHVDIGGEVVKVVDFEFNVYDYQNIDGNLTYTVVFTRKQMPLRLAYGVTIHSSQGMSLDRLNINFGKRTFANNIAYVALSRARDLTKISFIRPLRLDDIKVDSEALGFFKILEED